jgi:hypothetical protein
LSLTINHLGNGWDRRRTAVDAGVPVVRKLPRSGRYRIRSFVPAAARSDIDENGRFEKLKPCPPRSHRGSRACGSRPPATCAPRLTTAELLLNAPAF